MTSIADAPRPEASDGVADQGAGPLGKQPRPSRTARAATVWLAVAAAGLFIALLIFGISSQSPNTSIDNGLAHGRPVPAPAFTLAVLQRGDLNGPLRRLAPTFANPGLGIRQLRGTPVVLNVWASWCDPCKQEAPLLEHAWRTEARAGGTLFLGLDQQDLTGDAVAFMRAYHIDYPTVRDPSNDVPRSYGATGIPETYFISPQGRVVDHIIGVITPQELHDGIIAARAGRPLGVKSGGARRPSR